MISRFWSARGDSPTSPVEASCSCVSFFDIGSIMNFLCPSKSFGSILNFFLQKLPSFALLIAIFSALASEATTRNVEKFDSSFF